jgi:Synaptotagmin-like mitochondrial-lipid-binding domain/C2 domain
MSKFAVAGALAVVLPVVTTAAVAAEGASGNHWFWTICTWISGFVFGSLVILMTTSQATKRGGGSQEETSPLISRRDVASLSLYDSIKNDNSFFVSDLIQQLWPYIDSTVSRMIQEKINDVLKDSLKKAGSLVSTVLGEVRAVMVELGSQPILIQNLTVHPLEKLENGIAAIKVDFDICWDGQCHIVLQAENVGKFGIEGIHIHNARLSVILQPLSDQGNNPAGIVRAVSLAFINTPVVEIDFVGLANIADTLKILSQTIRSTIQQQLVAMVVLPIRIGIALDPTTSFFDMYHPPIGILQASIVSGRRFKKSERNFASLGTSDVADIYCTMSVGSGASNLTSLPTPLDTAYRTPTIQNNLNPTWASATSDFLLYDENQAVIVHAWDEDPVGSDDLVGTTDERTTVQSILSHAPKKASLPSEVELPLYGSGKESIKPTGAFIFLQCKLRRWSSQLDSLTAGPPTGTTAIGGVLTVLISGAKSVGSKSISTFVTVQVSFSSQSLTFSTKVIQGENPAYQTTLDIPLPMGALRATASAAADDFLLLSLMKGTALGDEDTVCLGKTVVSSQTLLESPTRTITESRALINEKKKTGLLEFRVILRGIESFDARTSDVKLTSQPTATPKALVRVTVLSASDLRVEKHKFRLRKSQRSDTPDSYVRVEIVDRNNRKITQPWQTSTITDSLEPIWNESKDFHIDEHLSHSIRMEIYDVDDAPLDRKDDHLGSVHVSIQTVLLSSNDGIMIIPIEPKSATASEAAPTITIRCEVLEDGSQA